MLRRRVLLVEDEFWIAEECSAALRAAHMDVVVALSGYDAIDHARINHFDIMVLDLGLPDISGFTVLKRLRDAGKKWPVVVLSGDLESKEQMLKLGVECYLVKPYDAEMLSDIVSIVCKRVAAPMRPPLLSNILVFA